MLTGHICPLIGHLCTKIGTVWGNLRIFQILIIETSGLLFIALIYRLARSGKLSFRYVIGWISLAVLIIASGPMSFALVPISNALDITQGALISIIGLIIVLLICIQLSISISGIHERQRRMSEELSQLRNQFEFPNRK